MPEVVEQICNENGIKHFLIDLDGFNQQLLDYRLKEDIESTKQIRDSLRQLVEMLTENEENAMLHCYAGIHRTGMFGYTLLRLVGKMEEKEAFETLKDMRIEAYEGVESWRIERAETELVKDYLNDK